MKRILVLGLMLMLAVFLPSCSEEAATDTIGIRGEIKEIYLAATIAACEAVLCEWTE